MRTITSAASLTLAVLALAPVGGAQQLPVDDVVTTAEQTVTAVEEEAAGAVEDVSTVLGQGGGEAEQPPPASPAPAPAPAPGAATGADDGPSSAGRQSDDKGLAPSRRESDERGAGHAAARAASGPLGPAALRSLRAGAADATFPSASSVPPPSGEPLLPQTRLSQPLGRADESDGAPIYLWTLVGGALLLLVAAALTGRRQALGAPGFSPELRMELAGVGASILVGLGVALGMAAFLGNLP
jgi:hypothetical protein